MQLFTSNDADEQVWKRLSHLRTPSPSTMGIRANVAAFTEGREWLRDVIGQLDRNRTLLAELLSERIPAIRYEPPEATFLAWLDCRDLDLGTDPGEFFLREARVAFNPGPMFGQGGEGHVRLNLATSPSILDEAVGRMAEALRRAGRAG